MWQSAGVSQDTFDQRVLLLVHRIFWLTFDGLIYFYSDMENSCWSLNTILGENPDSTNLGNPVVVFSLLLCLPDKPLSTRSNNPDNSVTRWPNHSSAPECYPNVSSGLITDRCWRGIHNWGHPHHQHRSYHRSCHKCRSSCCSCSSRARGHPCHSSSSCDRGSCRWH